MRVLLLEDEALLQRSTSRLIRRAFRIEMTIDVTDTVAGAIALLEASTYNFVLSDFNVRGGTSSELLIWLYGNQKYMVERFVFFSGAAGLGRWHHKIITKDVVPSEFVVQLRNHLSMVPVS